MTSSHVEIRLGFLDAAVDSERFFVSTDGERTTYFVLGPSSEIAEGSGSIREDGNIGAADERRREAQGLVGPSPISKHAGDPGHDGVIVWKIADDLPEELFGDPHISVRPRFLG
jgi:hypothetical protein